MTASIDALEARAFDDPEAQRALLAALAERAAARSLFSAAELEALYTHADRALDLLGALGVDPPALGPESALHAATLARALARDDRAPGDHGRAIALLRDAYRWQRHLGANAALAETAIELARALDERGQPSDHAWKDALAPLREAADLDDESRAFLFTECATYLARSARAQGDTALAAALEAESDALDDRAIASALARLEPAVRWFSARWSDAEAPAMVAPSEWIEQSMGLVRNPSDDPALAQSMRCARVFGADLDFVCLCGVRHERGAPSCERCGVEPMRAARSLARIGHVELPATLVHPSALHRGPHGSLVALALDMSDERLEQVLADERCLRRAAIRPRGADTLEPGSIELREHDEGRTDPSVVIGTGEDAVIATLEALDAEGAIAECGVERRMLEAHRSAATEATQRRIRALGARESALAVLLERGVESVCVSVVPHWSARWIAQQPDAAEITDAYRTLLADCEPLRARWQVDVAERRALRGALDRLCAAVGRGRR